MAISDILAKKEMPEHIRQDIALYVGCITGASQVQQYKTYLGKAGFIGELALMEVSMSTLSLMTIHRCF